MDDLTVLRSRFRAGARGGARGPNGSRIGVGQAEPDPCPKRRDNGRARSTRTSRPRAAAVST